MSKYRITVENIPGMGGTLKDAPVTIECDGLCVIGVTERTESEFSADTSLHSISPRQIARVIMENPLVRQAVMACEVHMRLAEFIDGQ